ncbi:class II fructose-bisphosphatase [Candidatus Bandiella numerosa]|uniref:class II fructose-bisphosphatase n=1 Tax=Candidatus Bandiella numerosa TaxID=2570586 RepID=UPI001F02A002|nr:class II fructose-bisphosphatase [Candidatus Bandiella numerosa]
MNNSWLYSIQNVTELTAIACYDWIGKGDNVSADKVAVDVMRQELNKLPMNGKVAIGEGERDKAPMLYIGEELGKGGESIDIAVDPLEGTTICARADYGSMAVIAISSKNSFLYAPDLYMQKIAISAKYPKNIIDINFSAKENVLNLAKYKKCNPSEIIIMMLDRERHKSIIEEIRTVGAKIRLISDGDISAVIAAAIPDNDVDIYIGTGGAPEGVLAASALRCVGGRMQGRLVFKNNQQILRAKAMGITDINKIYEIEDLVKKDVIFAATGVTDGLLVNGVQKYYDKFTTETLLLSSAQKMSYKVKTTRY